MSGRTADAVFGLRNGHADSWVSVLPEKWWLIRIGGAVLDERCRIQQYTICHCVLDTFTMTYILGRVVAFLDYDEIGEFSFFQRTDIAIETEVLRSVESAAGEGFFGSHASLNEAPDFPMGADPIQLSMTSGLDEASLVETCFSDRRHVLVIIVVFMGGHPSSGSRLENVRRNERFEARVGPQVVVSVPVVFAPEAAVGHGESRGVADTGAAPKVEHVVIDVLDRHGVFNAGVAVNDHGEIVHESRTPFRDDHHFLFTSGGNDLLPLIAPRLVVALYTNRPNRFHTREVELGIFKRLDLSFESAGGSIKNRTGRKYPRSRDKAGFAQLAGRKDGFRITRRIVNSSHSKR